MKPALPAGSLVIAASLHDGDRLQAGDIVVARRPDRPTLEIIKRIHSVDAAGTIFLVGDNPAASTDSRDFGAVTREQIIGLVRWRYWPLPPKRL
jgi:nickel-type superoxide dismutase maturation protease